MAKKMDKIKTAMYITVSFGSIIMMIVAALNYFARAKTVNLLDRRLELSIEDDRVFQAEQDVDWMKQQAAFERRKAPATQPENEMIQRAEKKLTELKGRRAKKQDAYEKAK